MLIAVTHDHIERGVSGSCNRCAVALALEEQTGAIATAVSYEQLKVRLFGDVAWRAIHTPPEVAEFMSAFDHPDPAVRATARPFLFEFPDARLGGEAAA